MWRVCLGGLEATQQSPETKWSRNVETTSESALCEIQGIIDKRVSVSPGCSQKSTTSSAPPGEDKYSYRQENHLASYILLL